MFDQNPVQPSSAPQNAPQKTSPLSNPPLVGQPPVPRPPQVEDMFLETDKNSVARVSRPFVPGQASQMPMSGEVFGGRSFWENKILIVALVLVALALIGAGVWAAVSFFSSRLTDISTTSNTDLNINTTTNTNVNSEVNNNTDINTNTAEEINTNTNNANETADFIDSDNDGLSDEEEKQLGTDPNNFDTDSDGLVDRVEVRIYKTNPLQKDTDGDGFNDGQEVLSGFDPAQGGGAKLFNVPQS